VDIKQWFGLAGAGVIAVAVSFLMARPATQEPQESPAKKACSSEKTSCCGGGVPAGPAVASTPAAPAAATPAVVKADAPRRAGGTIKGTIKWEGKAVKNKVIDMGSADPVCTEMHAGQELREEKTIINGNGTLKNVVIYLEGVEKKDWPVRADTVTLDQKGCQYVPHVVAIQVGQKLEIRNSDKTTHNVHFKSKYNGDWNKTQSEVGTVPPDKEVSRPEIGSAFFKCDIHTWMESRVAIFDHPFFAVSGEDGSFSIADVPPGTYKLKAWHEKEKEQEQSITVEDGKPAEVTFTFGKK
jgi:plastocyanin